MKDYSNYRKPALEKMMWSMDKTFQNQLKFEGTMATIENYSNVKFDSMVVIRNHSNPLNEFKEERYIISGKDVDIERGYLINYGNDKYIITTDIDKDNPTYNTSKMLRCNYTLKHKTNQGDIIEIPSIVSNKLDYSLGVTGGNPLLIPNDRMKILISDTLLTDSIFEEIKFVVDRKVYMTTHVDRVTRSGLKDLTLEIRQKTPNDDIENGIAYNEFEEIKEIPTPTNQLIIEGESTIYYIDAEFEYIAKLYNGDILVETQPEIIYEVDRVDLFDISQAGNILKIKPKTTNNKKTQEVLINATDGTNIAGKLVKIRSLI